MYVLCMMSPLYLGRVSVFLKNIHPCAKKITLTKPRLYSEKSEQERDAIVKECIDGLKSPTELAIKHNVSAQHVRRWVKKAGHKLPTKYNKVKPTIIVKPTSLVKSSSLQMGASTSQQTTQGIGAPGIMPMAKNFGMPPATTGKAPVAKQTVTSGPVTSDAVAPPISNSQSIPSTISLPKDTTSTLNLSFKNQESTLVTQIMVITYPPSPSKNDTPSTSQQETQDINFLTKNPIEIQGSSESPEQKIHFEKSSSNQINVSAMLPVEKLVQVPNGNLFAQVSGSVNDLHQQISELNNNECFEEDNSTAICHMCLKCLEKSYMLDCGHLGFCDICSKDVLSKKLPKVPKCPICGKIVKSRLQVYLNLKYKRKRINKESPELITIT